MKKILSLMLLFILLIGSTFGVFHFYFYQDDNFQQVVVVVNKIDANTMIEEKDVTLKRVHKDNIYDQYFQKTEDVLGSYTDYYQVLLPNQLIEKNRVKSLDSLKESVHFELLANQTTFSIQVDLLKSSGNTFAKHQKVDLYGVIKPLQSDPIVDLVLSNVRIIAVLDRNGLEIAGQESIPSIINIAIDEVYVAFLSKLQKMGTIELYASNNFQEKSESLIVKDSLIVEYLNFSN